MGKFFDAESVRQKKRAADERRLEEERKRAELLARERSDLQDALHEYFDVLAELEVEADLLDARKGAAYYFYAPIRNPDNERVSNQVFAVTAGGELHEATIPPEPEHPSHHGISVVPMKAPPLRESISDIVSMDKYPPSALLKGLKASFQIRQESYVADSGQAINWLNPPSEHQV